MLCVWLGAWLSCALWLGVYSVWLGVLAVCARSRAGARAGGRRSFLL